MQFRAEFTPGIFLKKIKITDNLLLVGSCFTEQIGKKISAHKFNTLENPNGILFNPISIAKAITGYAAGKLYTESDLFYYNELWASKDHHTRFSDPDKEACLRKINAEQEVAAGFIKKADFMLLTLGSAFVYEWKDEPTDNYKNVAANCHKIATDKFNRRLLKAGEIVAALQQMQQSIIKINPTVKIIYTVSPVRHLREGFVENNRSKASLIQAIHDCTNDENCFYFPAYELIIDDLRDYRFFAEDLVHPNYAATNYVWEKFVATVIDEPSQIIMKEINELNAARSHKPFNPLSAAHKTFREKNKIKILSLQQKFPFLPLNDDLNFFS
jgi:hypothetical protein